MDTLAKSDRKARNASRLFALLLLFCGYFSANLLLRWLRNCLFHARMTEGWTDISTWAIVYQMIMACLAVALWAWILYGVALRVPRLLNPVVITLLLLLVLIGVEIDMNWFRAVRTRVTYGIE
jgi:hypothetical protein